MSSCARYSIVSCWYFHLPAVPCFGLKCFHRAAVLLRDVESKFPLQIRIWFLKEMLYFSIFQVTLQVVFFFFPPTFFLSLEHSVQKDWVDFFSLMDKRGFTSNTQPGQRMAAHRVVQPQQPVPVSAPHGQPQCWEQVKRRCKHPPGSPYGSGL